MKRLGYVCIMLCLILGATFVAAPPQAAASCSGDNCGCGEANNACAAECRVEHPCVACQALTLCMAGCRREMRACATACCGEF
jgi:hypothetical protein